LLAANQEGVATMGMKDLGLGRLPHEVEGLLHYPFSLPLSTLIVGKESVA
jgi:hypothetical protein